MTDPDRPYRPRRSSGVVVLIGPAGSGKSTHARRWASDAVVSLDHLRALVAGEAGDQAATADAVDVQQLLLKARFRRGLPVVVDSTNVEPDVRRAVLALAGRYGRSVHAIRVLPPLTTCVRRNARRPAARRVPVETVRWQHALAQAASPDVLRAEGFATAHDLYPPTSSLLIGPVRALHHKP